MIKLTNILREGKVLSVFDFDDTIAKSDAWIYVLKGGRTIKKLDPAQFAVYNPKPGETFNFRDFDRPMRNPKLIKRNADLLRKQIDKARRAARGTRKVTILTARRLGTPVTSFLKTMGIDAYVVPLGSNNPLDKAKWIESQIKKGYDTVYFMDDSNKNIAAVNNMLKMYPNVKSITKLIKENSSNSVSYSADSGEPDTGFIHPGKERKLGKRAGKPEPWFEKLDFTQVEFPVADYLFGKGYKPNFAVTKRILSDVKGIKSMKLKNILKEILSEDNGDNLSPEQEILMQTLGKKYEAFVTDLDDEVGDDKVQAALQAGLSDGDVEDDKIDIREVSIPVKNLRPTQNEIDIGKSLNWPLQKDTALLKDYIKGKDVVIMAPIITLNEKWVIDGHHRWSQVYAFNANATMKCANMSFPGMDPIYGLKAVQSAIAVVMGEIPQNSVEGTNLLKAPEDQVKSDIVQMIGSGSVGAKALKILKGFRKIKNLDAAEAADYIWQQIEVMQTNAKPAVGAPKRGFMPQTDEPSGKFPKLAQLLKKGVVNWNDPF